MTETEKERLIKDIQEAIVEIPFTGSAKEIQTYINAYMDAQERILALIIQSYVERIQDCRRGGML